jgi:AraC-like DNA-binding protein
MLRQLLEQPEHVSPSHWLGANFDGALLDEPFFAEALFDLLADVVFFVKDTSGRYLVVNTTLMRRCGFEQKGSLIGRSPIEVFPPELGASYAGQDRQVIATGNPIHDRLELHLYPNRVPGWCLTHKIPLSDRNGQIVGVAGISRDLRMADKQHPVYRRIAAAVAYIHEHYAEPLHMKGLAGMANVSVAQFERYIQRIFDLTPKQLIIKIRVENAAHLLAGDQSVAEIAQDCGYADHSAFSRQFKAVVGVSPTRYRMLQGANKLAEPAKRSMSRT